MEEKVFFQPAVAGQLENYVEARLHCDKGPRQKEYQELQMKLANTKAQPVYVIMDPEDEAPLGLRAGATLADPTPFIDLLKSGVIEHSKKTGALETAVGEKVAGGH